VPTFPHTFGDDGRECKDVVRKIKTNIEESGLDAVVEVMGSTINWCQSCGNIEEAVSDGARKNQT